MGSRISRLVVRATKTIVGLVLSLAFFAASIQFFLALRNDSKAFPGYTLVAPLFSTKTHLIDMQGRSVRTWESDHTPGQAA
jgi:hypothetical protein